MAMIANNIIFNKKETPLNWKQKLCYSPLPHNFHEIFLIHLNKHSSKQYEDKLGLPDLMQLVLAVPAYGLFHFSFEASSCINCRI